MFSTAVRMLSLPLNEAEAKIAVVFFNSRLGKEKGGSNQDRDTRSHDGKYKIAFRGLNG